MPKGAEFPGDPNKDPEQLAGLIASVPEFLYLIVEQLDDDEMRNAVSEYVEYQLPNLQADLRNADFAELAQAGLTGAQLAFKIKAITRSTEEASAAVPSEDAADDTEKDDGDDNEGVEDDKTGGYEKFKKKVKNALGKIKVVLDSVKGLSKWLEALTELVEMADKALD